MTEPVNLNKVRKAKARAEAGALAASNRVKFGRTKGEKQAEAKREAQRKALLDGAKRER